MGDFTFSIFKALAKRKIHDEQLRAAMRVGVHRFEALKTGTRELTNRESFELEQFTGQSSGQLAYEGCGIQDAGLKKVLDAWAKVGKIGPNDRYESPSASAKKRKSRRSTRSTVPALVRGV